MGGEHSFPGSRTCQWTQLGLSYTGLAQSGATCGSESSAPWWRPGGQAASGRRRPDGCDSGVAPRQGGGRPDWGSDVGRATAQLITSCWESLSPARGDSQGGQARSLSAGASVSKMNSEENACSGGAPRPRVQGRPQTQQRPGSPDVAHSAAPLPRCARGTSTREAPKCGGEHPSLGASVRHRVPRLTLSPVDREPEHGPRG